MITKSNIALLLVCALSISACSDAEKILESPPPIVEDLNFPYIKDSTLYEFDPQSGESTIVESIPYDDEISLLVQSPEGLMVYLDTDPSTEVREDNEDDEDEESDTPLHTPLPESVVYTKGPSLYLFDFHTRRTHKLITLTDQASNESESICDLRGVITMDEENRLLQKTLHKNEEKVYIQTSDTDCAQGPYHYYQINIEEYVYEEFEVIRETLLEHNHPSSHAHEHEDTHNHLHSHEDGEIGDDGLPYDTSNHLHNHLHTHDLQYGDLEEHGYLSQEEIDAVHAEPQYIEVNYETHTTRVGKKRIINEALMYSSQPIFDQTNNRFGYLGFNRAENEYRFYVVDLETLIKTLEWRLELSSLSPSIPPLPAELSDGPGRAFEFTYANQAIVFQHGNRLIKLPLLALFDDDQEIERERRFESPLLEFVNPDDASYRYNEGNDTLYIRNGIQISQIENLASQDTLALIKEYSADTVENLTAFITGENLIIQKDLELNGQQSDFEISSIVELDTANSLEETLVTGRSHYLKLSEGEAGQLFMYSESDDGSSLEARSYGTNIDLLISSPLINSIWGNINNKLYDIDGAIGTALLNSQNISFLDNNGSNVPALSQPSVYEFDGDNQLGHGRLLGTLPNNVREVIEINLESDYFGTIKVKESYEADAPINTYFFPSGLSYINVTGDFGDMKFMYNDQSTAED